MTETSFAIHPSAAYTWIDDEAVVLGGKDNSLYGVNPVGAEILKCIESKKSISINELTAHLLECFDVDHATCEADTKTFLASMLAEDLVVIVHE